jgi:hypothetical protein
MPNKRSAGRSAVRVSRPVHRVAGVTHRSSVAQVRSRSGKSGVGARVLMAAGPVTAAANATERSRRPAAKPARRPSKQGTPRTPSRKAVRRRSGRRISVRRRTTTPRLILVPRSRRASALVPPRTERLDLPHVTVNGSSRVRFRTVGALGPATAALRTPDRMARGAVDSTPEPSIFTAVTNPIPELISLGVGARALVPAEPVIAARWTKWPPWQPLDVLAFGHASTARRVLTGVGVATAIVIAAGVTAVSVSRGHGRAAVAAVQIVEASPSAGASAGAGTQIFLQPGQLPPAGRTPCRGCGGTPGAGLPGAGSGVAQPGLGSGLGSLFGSPSEDDVKPPLMSGAAAARPSTSAGHVNSPATVATGGRSQGAGSTAPPAAGSTAPAPVSSAPPVGSTTASQPPTTSAAPSTTTAAPTTTPVETTTADTSPPATDTSAATDTTTSAPDTGAASS